MTAFGPFVFAHTVCYQTQLITAGLPCLPVSCCLIRSGGEGVWCKEAGFRSWGRSLLDVRSIACSITKGVRRTGVSAFSQLGRSRGRFRSRWVIKLPGSSVDTTNRGLGQSVAQLVDEGGHDPDLAECDQEYDDRDQTTPKRAHCVSPDQSLRQPCQRLVAGLVARMDRLAIADAAYSAESA